METNTKKEKTKKSATAVVTVVRADGMSVLAADYQLCNDVTEDTK
jgi:LysM repeat protein